MTFHQQLSSSTVIFPMASKFLSSALLLEFIQIKQETIKYVLKTKEGQGKKWLMEMELGFS